MNLLYRVASCRATEQKSKASNAFAIILIVEFVEHSISLVCAQWWHTSVCCASLTRLDCNSTQTISADLWDWDFVNRQMVALAVSVGKRWSVAGQEHGFDDRQFSPFGKARLKQTQICDLISVLFNQPVPHHWMVHLPAADLRFTQGWFHMIGRMFLYCWYTLEWSFWWPKTPAPIGPWDPSIQLISHYRAIVTLRHSALSGATFWLPQKKKKTVRSSNSRDFDWSSKWRSKMILSRVPSASRATLMTCLTFGRRQRRGSKLSEIQI